MNWHLSHRADPRALPLADRHYNRQKPGTPQFVPPGRCLVLLTANADALWVTSWPKAEYVMHRWAGAWVNSLFRREGGATVASELIREAVAATVAHFGPPPPTLGMVSFVDRDEVKRKRDPGRCYRRAGFFLDKQCARHGWSAEPDTCAACRGETEGGLLAFRMPPEAMPAPARAVGDQLQIGEAG